MNNYNFSTLHDKELEMLARDLLNAEFKLDLQDFKAGKDKGIDLRYASKKNLNQIVVQVKHYLKTGFDGLLYHLENIEKPKVEKLKPIEYYLVTSVPLSPPQKDMIKDKMAPFILNTNYIIGQEDLNKYLSKHKSIERKYYKLWLTSTSVLQTIINNGAHHKSTFYEAKIKKDISFFVKNKNYNDAKDKIKEHKFILITGTPGIGKTTLAFMLAYDLMAKKYELTYIDQDIKQAEDLLDEDPLHKQIFLLDDFLGANYSEIINPKSPHSTIISFLDRLVTLKNKYCILTTRTNILYKSYLISEKLKNSSVDIGRLEIEIKNYSQLDKARILYNHLVHHNVPDNFLNKFFSNKLYWNVIDHKNYTPRLIEFFTKEKNLTKIKDEDQYYNFIIRTLDNPEEIWLHAFNEQVEDDDRFLILALFSFGKEVSLEDLEFAFNLRINYEIKENGHNRKVDSFNNSLKRLMDSFIKSNRTPWGQNSFAFINPSINDFLVSLTKNSKEERIKLIEVSIFFTQFERLQKLYKHFIENGTPVETDELLFYLKKFEKGNAVLKFDDLDYYRKSSKQDTIEGDEIEKLLKICTFYFSIMSFNTSLNEKLDTLLLENLSKIKVDDLRTKHLSYVLTLLYYTYGDHKSHKYLKDHLFELSDYVLVHTSDIKEIRRLKEDFLWFDTDFSEYLSDTDRQERYTVLTTERLESYLTEFAEDLKSSIYSEEDYEKTEKQIWREYQLFSEKLDIKIDYDIKEIMPVEDLEELISNNISSSDNLDDWSEKKASERSSKLKIDDLFSK